MGETPNGASVSDTTGILGGSRMASVQRWVVHGRLFAVWTGAEPNFGQTEFYEDSAAPVQHP